MEIEEYLSVFAQLHLDTGILPFLPPFYSLLASPEMRKVKSEKTSSSPSFLWPDREESGVRRGMHPRFHKHPVVPVAVPVATAQWELQMASGYSQGWSHVRDKRSHSCCCWKKSRLCWIPECWRLGAGLGWISGEQGEDAGPCVPSRPEPRLWIGVPRSPGMTQLHFQSMWLTQIQHPARQAQPGP